MDNKRRFVTIATICGIIIPIFVIVAGLYYWVTQEQRQLEQTFVRAKEFYFAGDLNQARDTVLPHLQKLIALQDGCELVISVYAQLQGYAQELEQVARECIKEKKALGLAHEGLAKSLLEQNRIKEAIDILKAESILHNEPRIYGALANLYLFDQQYQQAADQFTIAIASANEWSMWLSRSLKFDKIANSVYFLEHVTPVILEKPQTVAGVEKQLLVLLKSNQLHELVHLLEQRLNTRKPKDV